MRLVRIPERFILFCHTVRLDSNKVDMQCSYGSANVTFKYQFSISQEKHYFYT
jgi:hypothetical protein